MITFPYRAGLRASPLLTPRTELVPIEPQDAGALFRVVETSRASLLPWLPWVPYTTDPDATRRFADACVEDWDQSRAIRLLIRDRSSHALMGVVGLESVVHLHRSCELGYWLHADAQGKGLMTEAASALIHMAFDHFGVHRIRVAAATGNHRSLAVIARLGFRFEGISRQAEFCAGRWLDHAVFGLLETDQRK